MRFGAAWVFGLVFFTTMGVWVTNPYKKTKQTKAKGNGASPHDKIDARPRPYSSTIYQVTSCYNGDMDGCMVFELAWCAHMHNFFVVEELKKACSGRQRRRAKMAAAEVLVLETPRNFVQRLLMRPM